MKFVYPKVRKDDSIKENLHGIEIEDPYRWLEDPDSKETEDFVAKQNEIAMKYINSSEHKEKFKNRLTEVYNYPKYGCPFKRGDKYYYFMNTGLQNQSVLYQQNDIKSESIKFFDPNELSEEGTTALSVYSFSEDGKYFAYGLNESGSDWINIRIRDVETGKDLNEVLKKCKFTGISWTHDNLGFFYSRYPDNQSEKDTVGTIQDVFHKVYYHRINTPQSDDVLCVEFPNNPKYLCSAEVSSCGKLVFIEVTEKLNANKLFYSRIDEKSIDGELKLIEIIGDFDNKYDYITNFDDDVILRTNYKAPNFKLIKVNLNDLNREKWIDLVPENKKDVLDDTLCVNNNILFIHLVRDVHSVIELRNANDGSFIKELKIPIGSLSSLSGKKKQSEVFFNFTSFLTPCTTYHIDFNKGLDYEIFRETTIENFDQSNYKVEQVFYKSKDETSIPMFIITRKDFEANGDNPCLIFGYGGFNISVTPSFSVSRLLFVQHLRGVFALANIRGGGEYGQNWYDGGKLFNKQNCFDDFQSAGEYLIENKYTNSRKLVIEGGSNGGLLVAACANQRPDLFAAVITRVGVLDMLRFHKFTIGSAWISDYGNPDEEKHFYNLIKFSPLHNIPKHVEKFPATLIMTGDHDDRVVPGHSLKYTARLQELLGEKLNDTPLILRIDMKAGHGHSKPTAKIIEEVTDIYCFIMNALNIQYTD